MKQKIEELKVPKKGKSGWIITGYITALCGGLIGLIIGWKYWKEINTLPNAEKVLRYDAKTKRHGKIIFYIGFVVINIAILYKIRNYFD